MNNADRVKITIKDPNEYHAWPTVRVSFQFSDTTRIWEEMSLEEFHNRVFTKVAWKNS